MDEDAQSHSRSFAPLSERERNILALLAEDLSDREIAARLVLAYTTVKWYNRQIFNKLGVENRQQAVERARAVGLLDSSAPAQTSAHNLPTQMTPFVSRVGELEDLNRLLIHSSVRLVTILAPGGMGKTRLALTTAETVQRQFAEGIYFVPLAPLTSPDQLVATVAEYLGLQFASDRRAPKQQLFEFLRAKHALLVLDNFEHLLEGASLVADLLSAAPYVKVIVTSRQLLDLDGETVYRLGGMPYPKESVNENLLDYGAVQLFLECARRAYPHFVDYDMESIVHVCQLVEGMPLAIELAAAWVKTLAPAEIADEIARSADFLHTTQRNTPERMRSIRAIFETTWRRLSADERQVFRRMSVFHGGCTREAAHVVAGAELVTLTGLVDKALLWHHPENGRYEIHELLRQYAAEQLKAAGEAEVIQDAHHDYFGKLAREWGTALKTPKQLQALDVLEADLDNLREGFQRGIDARQPEAVEPFAELWYFYEIRARYSEGIRLFGSAIEALEGQDSLALGKLMAGQSLFVGRMDASEQSRSYAQRSVEMLRRVGAARETPMPLMQLGDMVGTLGDLEGQAALYHEGFEVAQRFGDRWAMACLLFLLGASAYWHGRVNEASRLMSEANILLKQLGNYWLAGFVLRDLARIAFNEGDYEKAMLLFEAGLDDARKVNHPMNIWWGLEGLYWITRVQGDKQRAKRHTDEMLKIALDWGSSSILFDTRLKVVDVATTSGNYSEARQHLREVLNSFSLDNEPNNNAQISIVYLSATAAFFAAAIDAKAQAVVLASFAEHDPQHDIWPQSLRENLQQLKTQMRSELPTHVFDAAWKQGQVLNNDEVLATLHNLLER